MGKLFVDKNFLDVGLAVRRAAKHRAYASTRMLASIFALIIVAACAERPPTFERLEGQTMGTYYRVQFLSTDSCAPTPLQVDYLLQEFNQSLSTYIPGSEISRFNAAPANTAVAVSERFWTALLAAKQIYDASQGAFDITIGPLVNLWGFGPTDGVVLPSEAEQTAASAAVGMSNLQLQVAPDQAAEGLSGEIVKTAPGVYIDLSAIAKGQGVDEVAALLESQGCMRYMVDIGGEVRVRGLNPSGTRWRIGIETPEPGLINSVFRVVHVTDQAVATSGDYRNFRLVEGIRVDHVIDPRSGKPAANAVASVTVVHPTAMFADAYSTTMMVLGADAGLAFAAAQNLAVFMVIKTAEDQFEARYTDAMLAFLNNPNDS